MNKTRSREEREGGNESSNRKIGRKKKYSREIELKMKFEIIQKSKLNINNSINK